MGMLTIFERGGDDAKRFDMALKKAKAGLMEACEIWEDMVDQFSERGGSYEERYSQRGGYRGREWDDMPERRSRDGMGRYR